MSKRLSPAMRKAQIMTAALAVADRIGYKEITRSNVAIEAGVTDSLVSLYWGTMTKLRRAVMRKAINTGNLNIIAQGLVAKDKNAMKAPKDLQQQAIQQLIN